MESSYFDNYVPLYIKSGNMIVVYDMLMVQMVIEIVGDEEVINKQLFNVFHLPYEDHSHAGNITQ